MVTLKNVVTSKTKNVVINVITTFFYSQILGLQMQMS
jgi:hypothetical protein